MDPGYHIYYIKNYCTQDAVSHFTQYFPYILLLLALVLAGIERFFDRLFSANQQIEGLSSLIAAAKKPVLEDSQQSDVNLEDTVRTVEVRQSFRESGNFYANYLTRTICEFLVASVLTAYMWATGILEIQEDFNVICRVHRTWYECSGVPTQFYLYVLFVALGLLCVYLVSTTFTILWLLCPRFGRLATFMREYENLLKKAARNKDAEAEPSRQELLGEMNEIYYENFDLRLLLDLLAATTGLSTPLRVLSLLDRNFRNNYKPRILNFERVAEIREGEGDLRVEIAESDLARSVFAKMSNLTCLYTVKISPRTDKSKLEVVFFDQQERPDHSANILEFFRRNKVNEESEEVPTQQVVFSGAEPSVSYTVKVTLILNGQAVAVSQKSVKVLVDPVTQAELDAQNTALAAQISQA